MTAFEVFLNDRRIAVAGVGSDGVLTAAVMWVGKVRDHAGNRSEDLILHVGGLVRSTEHVRWRQPPLHIGDELRIRIVRRRTVDPPRARHRRKPAQEVQQKKRYVRRLAKELGWTIGSGHSRAGSGRSSKRK